MRKGQVLDNIGDKIRNELSDRYRVVVNQERHRKGYPIYIYYTMLTKDERFGRVIGIEVIMTLRAAKHQNNVKAIATKARDEIEGHIGDGHTIRARSCEGTNCKDTWVGVEEDVGCWEECKDFKWLEVMVS